jgi:alpha-galactosidase
MLMEGCCGGGRRIDLESLSRFHWHQKSDSWFNTITDQAGMYGGNLYLPGGVLNLPTSATDNFGVWSSFGGQFCLAWHPLDKDFPMELAKKQVALYKRVRPYLSGDFYPLTDCTLDRPWLAYQFHRNDLNGGFALIFKRKAAEGDSFTFAPRGLDPEARYAISCQGSGTGAVYTGAELAKGIPLTLTGKPQAELVIYEKQP